MPLSSKTIRVPVRFVDGEWELLYGGPIRVNEATVGELHLAKDSVADKALYKALTQRSAVGVLPQGTELRVALSIKTLSPELQRQLLPHEVTVYDRRAKISSDARFARVFLGGPTSAQRVKGVKTGGLTLVLEGVEPRAIESGRVHFPTVTRLEPVDSLNHAFTRLSEAFEPWRKAHTGSIYERVFYQETGGMWFPLKDLRDRALASAERQVVQRLWANVVTRLGIRTL